MAPDRRGGASADVCGLVFDGERLQCAECGGWYRHLATHVFMAHGMLAADYRAEHGLGARVPLVVDEISETLRREALGRGTENLERWHEPGTAEHERVVAKIRATKREQADEYWAERLAAVGWSSWFDATGWAEDAGVGWSGIGDRLGISWQSARTAGMRAGAQLRHRSWRLFELAEAYVHEHGSLDYADGELGRFLNQARSYVRNSGRQSQIGAALDVLDRSWRLTAPERITRALATGEVFEHPAARRHRRRWQDRLAAAGWSSWTDALVWAARTGNGPPQIAQRLGSEAMPVSRSMQQHWRALAEVGEDPHAGAAPYILPPAAGCGGALTSDHDVPAEYRTGVDAERIQCLVCGLWLGNLGQHLPVHQLTSRQYRARFGLAGRVRMSGQRPRHTEPEDPAQYWAPILAAHHLPVDFEAAVAWAIEQGMSAPEFARYLGVPYLRLNAALKAAGLRFPTVGDRMIVAAKTHVAAGGNLSEPPSEVRVWLDTVRRGVREGRRSVFGPQLDQIDPQWYLTAQQRAAAAGEKYLHKSTRSMHTQYETGLARAGWDSIEHAVAWARAHGAPASAIGIATGISIASISASLKKLGYRLPAPAKSGGSFHSQLASITAYLHRHDSRDGLPEHLVRWLERRHQLETADEPLPDPWINALLDHLHPTWRTPPGADTSSDAGTASHSPPDLTSETAATAPAPYTVDAVWQARLHRAGWSSWNEAIDWAADHQAGLGAIADHLDVRKGEVLDQLQMWWNAHPDTLTTVTPPDGGQLVLPGRGTHVQCPACRLWFPDTAAHYSAAHPQLPHADADNPPPATTSGKPRPRTTTPAKPAARKPKKKP